MLQLIYSHTDYTALLQAYAEQMGTAVQGNTLVFPEAYGRGTCELLVMPNGLQAFLLNHTINQDFYIKREKSKEEFYILRIDEVTISDDLVVNMDGFTIEEHNHVRAAVLLTSSLFDVSYFISRGSSIRSINVLLTREWLATYLGISPAGEVLRRYLALKSASFNLEPLDAGYRELMNEVLEAHPGERQPINIIRLQNRIMMLVERFFTRLHSKLPGLSSSTLPADEDIQRLMDAEVLLVKDFSVPAPTVAELARYAAMSETKFKNLFKKIYQSGPYEYYQKNRMHRARYLLLTRNYSVKETGKLLGFGNLSNFTIAFKKEFGMLPSEV